MYSGDEFYGDDVTSPSEDRDSRAWREDGPGIVTLAPGDEGDDAEARCERCGFLEGGTFCQFTCGGGTSPADQAREAAEYDYTAQFDSVRERYAGETGRLDGDEEEFKAKNEVKDERPFSHEFDNGVRCYDRSPIVWANGEDCLHEEEIAPPKADRYDGGDEEIAARSRFDDYELNP